VFCFLLEKVASEKDFWIVLPKIVLPKIVLPKIVLPKIVLP